jgi:hypothetical protein
MRGKYGIILLEKSALIIRIYEADNKAWKLLHYQNNQFKSSSTSGNSSTADLIELMAKLLTSDAAQYVSEWKTGARQIPAVLLQNISSAIGLEIEDITLQREQELLCKGMFTELW